MSYFCIGLNTYKDYVIINSKNLPSKNSAGFIFYRSFLIKGLGSRLPLA